MPCSVRVATKGDSPRVGRRVAPPTTLDGVTDGSDLLLDLFDLQPDGPDVYVGITPDEGPGRLFGGQVASQSLRAATLTRLGYLNAAHGLTNQGCHAFLATGLTQGAASREATEQAMRHYWVTRARFKNMIMDGSVTDDTSIAAYTLLVLHEESR